jgi:hypothetical protein
VAKFRAAYPQNINLLYKELKNAQDENKK